MNHKIEIPGHVEDMRIKHLPFLTMLGKLGEKEYTLREVRELNAAFLGVPIDKFPHFMPKDDKKVFHAICNSAATYEQVKQPRPPEKLTYNNQVYTLRDDFTKLPTSWYIDVDVAFENYGEAFEGMPILMAAFCYIEEGLSYGETDKHANHTNSLADRARVFEIQMPLNFFLDLQGFFLWKWNVLQPLLMATRKKRREQNVAKRKNSNGRKR